VELFPGLYALDDEEVLSRTDEPQPPRLARERVAALRELKPVLECALLGRQPADFGAPRGELAPRLEPASERVVLRIADPNDQQDG
jgi:hypothetical protein